MTDAASAATRPPPTAAARLGARVGPWLCAVACLLALAWSAQIQVTFNLEIYTEQFIGLLLGIGLAVVFLVVPARREGATGAIDLSLAALGLGVGLVLFVRYPALQAELAFRPPEALAISAIVLVLLVEAARRTTGFSLVVVFAAMLIYALIGHRIPGAFQAKQIAPDRLLSYLGLDTAAVLGTPLIIAATVVVAFIFFGRLIQACGGAEFFSDLSAACFGRFRGGPGKVEVVASTLFGTISGSAVANVVSTGIITIPLMKKAGYKSETAAGIEAVSSTGGQIMPPVMGAAAFLMAENLQLSYGEVALAALAPALLFYLSIFVQVDLEAARRGIGGMDKARLPRARGVLARGWIFLVPFAVLFAAMFSFNQPAEKAAIVAAASLVPLGAAIGYGGRRLTLRSAAAAIAGAGRDSVDVIVICALAGAVIGLLAITGLGFALGLQLIRLGQDSLPALLLAVAVICVVLGMGLPTTGVYLLVATLAAPSLVKLGVPPLAAHMFVFFFGCLSMITPPVALAAYAAANIAKADPMRVAVAACRLGWPAFVLPFVFAFTPELLLFGQAPSILGEIAACAVAVWIGSAAIAGRLFAPLAAGRRTALALAALGLLMPLRLIDEAYIVQIAAGVAAAALIALEFRRAP